MKKVLMGTLLALCFATGFTCSKQTPPATPAEVPAPSQEQMGAPAPGQPAEGQPAEVQPGAAVPAPGETAPPPPAGEAH